MDDRRIPSVSLHRFFVLPDAIAGDHVRFAADQARQIHRVLRLHAGDRVLVLDDTGAEMEVQLDATSSAVEGTILDRRLNAAEPRISLSLYIGLLKAAKLELVLQKCTEIGVSRFVPLATTRSVAAEPGGSRQRRFEIIVREAAEQSRRGRVPRVADAMPFAAGLADAVNRGPAIALWEEEAEHPLSSAPRPLPEGHVSLFVGPEGGFTAPEMRDARQRGVVLCTLGPRILRAETAAIAGAALLLAQLGEMGETTPRTG